MESPYSVLTLCKASHASSKGGLASALSEPTYDIKLEMAEMKHLPQIDRVSGSKAGQNRHPLTAKRSFILFGFTTDILALFQDPQKLDLGRRSKAVGQASI